MQTRKEADLLSVLVDRETLASFLGVTSRQVTNMARDGVIPPPVSRGRYALAASVKACVRHKSEHGDDPACKALTEERARLTRSRAAVAEMQERKLRGELRPISEFVTAQTAIASVIRANFLALPNRAAPVLVTMSDPRKIAEYLTARVHEALEATASTKFTGVGASTDADHDDGDDEDADRRL